MDVRRIRLNAGGVRSLKRWCCQRNGFNAISSVNRAIFRLLLYPDPRNRVKANRLCMHVVIVIQMLVYAFNLEFELL